MCFVPSRDRAGFSPLCEKRGVRRVPNLARSFFSVLVEEKGVPGALDTTAFRVVMIRQNVGFRGHVHICTSQSLAQNPCTEPTR